MFYVYDGSFEGFISAVTTIFRLNKNPKDIDFNVFGIIKDNDLIPLLESTYISNIPGIVMDFGGYIARNFGPEMTKTIYHAFLSEESNIENAILSYILIARKQHIDPIDQIYTESIRMVRDAARKVTRESHSYLGLLRFRKQSINSYNLTPVYRNSTTNISNNKTADTNTTTNISNCETADANTTTNSSNCEIADANTTTKISNCETEDTNTTTNSTDYAGLRTVNEIGLNEIRLNEIGLNEISLNEIDNSLRLNDVSSEVYIAKCEPVTCCLPLIAEHFVERFPNQIFLILDIKRNIAVIHQLNNNWTIMPYESSLEKELEFETDYEPLWQKYFKVLSIPERENPNLQSGNMPKRYWKYLIEKPGK